MQQVTTNGQVSREFYEGHCVVLKFLRGVKLLLLK
jgi:hypothetical protein